MLKSTQAYLRFTITAAAVAAVALPGAKLAGVISTNPMTALTSHSRTVDQHRAHVSPSFILKAAYRPDETNAAHNYPG